MATFEKTVGIVNFMQANGINTINLNANPATGKRLVTTDAGITARVSDKVEKLSAALSVSWFTPEDGEASWMVHPTGSGLDTLDSFSI
jgi:hypothetical protein